MFTVLCMRVKQKLQQILANLSGAQFWKPLLYDEIIHMSLQY